MLHSRFLPASPCQELTVIIGPKATTHCKKGGIYVRLSVYGTTSSVRLRIHAGTIGSTRESRAVYIPREVLPLWQLPACGLTGACACAVLPRLLGSLSSCPSPRC
eukprot:9374859-Alexandrium_andersonii.AAC.1